MNRGRRALLTVVALALLCAAPGRTPAAAEPAAPEAAPTVLITGSNRGIGFEFVRQYAGRGYEVIATTRNPAQARELAEFAAAHPNVRIEQLDVVDAASIAALAAKLRGLPIDVLINNAGTADEFKGQAFGSLAHDRFVPLMELNAHGPIRVAEALVDNVKVSRQKKIVAISSLAGSFGATAASGAPPGGYWYRASKAALDMLMLVLSRDLAPLGVTVACLSPGQVDTHGYAARGIRNPEATDIAVSVGGLIKVIDGLTPASTGRFIRFNGDPLPW